VSPVIKRRRVKAIEQQACSTPYLFKDLATGEYIGMGYCSHRLNEIAYVECGLNNSPLPKPHEEVLVVEYEEEESRE